MVAEVAVVVVVVAVDADEVEGEEEVRTEVACAEEAVREAGAAAARGGYRSAAESLPSFASVETREMCLITLKARSSSLRRRAA